MHKITKGLKKKKKGKKSKHKDEELFKPEELEAYRREHQAEQGEPATANDEWKKFNAITAGIDNFLKKTQDDLDRIKSTSFFQRVPPPSEQKKKREEACQNTEEVKQEEAAKVEEPGIVQVSETESEEEDEEDIFDTTYIDAIAAGEVKLAYIPESPTNELEGDDPFDTSIAERAILGPASVNKKGKKLVPLGAAVEVLTGRVQAPTCVPIKRPSTRRTILKEKDLLLGSFDDNANSLGDITCDSQKDSKPSLLDDNAPPSLADEPIDLSKTLHITPIPTAELSNDHSNHVDIQGVGAIEEFPLESEDDQEFALLAAESLNKTVTPAILPSTTREEPKETWQAFEGESKNSEQFEETESDPFDTTFAENAVPGKYELKLIENEILSSDDVDFNPRLEDKLKDLIKDTVQPTNPPCVLESELDTLQPKHRDLLAGSVTDLSNLGARPLTPADENYIEYCDPFDTTTVESATVPGQTELKFLEKELLSDIHNSDDDFDPRADENYCRKASSASVKAVNFTLPLPDVNSGLAPDSDHDGKRNPKPLTPYYVRENSLSKKTVADIESEEEEEDPFDTSFVVNITPGKAELKVIESELFSNGGTLDSISDQDFNPRDEKQLAVAKVVQTIKEISAKPPEVLHIEPQIDLLGVEHNEVLTKVLTPATNRSLDNEDVPYEDPFDTSIASNILPGKVELKLLETELIHTSQFELQSDITDSDFDPRKETVDAVSAPIAQEPPKVSIPDLLEHTVEHVSVKALTPLGIQDVVDFDELDDIDPFDTSFANNIGPGQTELKLLESELI
uniref:Protein stoned-A n=1 Tax=Photinus pyralis TaxID=7054 RepID=A0A1Y1MMK8_PHOPY